MDDHSYTEDTHKHGDRLFQVLIEHSSDIVVLVNLQGLITYVSPSITSILGYIPGALPDDHIQGIVHPNDVAAMQQVFEHLQQSHGGQMKAEYRLQHKDGTWRWFDATFTNLLHEPAVGAIMSTFHDITRHKEAEIALKKERERAELAQQAGNVGLFEWNIYRNQLVWRPENEELYSAPLDTLEGTYAAWTPYIHPDDLAATEAYLTELFARQARQFTIEMRILRPDQPLLWLLVKGRIEYDAELQPHRLVGVTIDITERKQIEEERIAIDRRKDEFISLASHELKTPLTGLKGYTQLLQRKVVNQGMNEYLFFLDRMDTQINRLTKLVQDLLDVSKIQTGKLNYSEEVFALDTLIEDTREMLQETSRHQLIFENRTPLYVYADRDRIGQVLINLLTNATKYSPGADKVIICMQQDNEDALVSIQDFGIGIAQVEQGKIFERFYRVHDQAEDTFPGMGIGLYICHEIIQRHHGQLRVESRKGEGSTFYFRLPLYHP